MTEEKNFTQEILQEFTDTVTQNLVHLVGAQAVRTIFEHEFSGGEVSLTKQEKVQFVRENIKEVAKRLTSLLVDRTIRNFGYEFSEHLLREIYDHLKEKYGAKYVAFLVFDIVPEGSLEQEKIKFLSKDELEKRVLERTKELQETNANLEKTVVERTKELVMANYKLKKAIEELKDLNKMKSEFLALASHQMRSPLSATMWSLERLKELFEKSSSVSEENRRLLEEALERNKRMAKLIDNLLNISRIEAGRFLQKVEAVSLDDVVRGVIDILPAPEEQRSIAVRYTSPKEQFIIMADTEKLALAIENIIDNAIKYSPPKATVDVAILRGAGNVAVYIKDQGMGIPKSEQEGVFGKFFRGQNAEKSQIPGSGLGLYLAKKIIDGHGGSMSFESEEGKGTTFFIQLPLVEEEKEKV